MQLWEAGLPACSPGGRGGREASRVTKRSLRTVNQVVLLAMFKPQIQPHLKSAPPLHLFCELTNSICLGFSFPCHRMRRETLSTWRKRGPPGPGTRAPRNKAAKKVKWGS